MCGTGCHVFLAANDDHLFWVPMQSSSDALVFGDEEGNLAQGITRQLLAGF